MSADTNVLCGFDDAYAPHFATMISSLFAASQNPERIKFHLMSNLLSPAVRIRLDQIVARYGVGRIQWLEVDCSPFADAPVTMHFTRETYARIAAFNVVGAERVLYLDVDLLCLADVAELHDWDLAGRPVGAILDPANTFGVDDHKAALGLPTEAWCFNGGVLVVDTARWRRERLTETCIDFLQSKKEAIWWVDQDVLNGVLVGKWFQLPSQWNVQTHFWKPAFRDCMAIMMPRELDVTRAPKIVHFNDPGKPWHFGYWHPYRELYLQHLSRSGWPHSISIATQNGIQDLVIEFER
jgi:lipopolysaccharide biosynthesis glycosyltransferase